MNPAVVAVERLGAMHESMRISEEKGEKPFTDASIANVIGEAQVYATLALANAVEGIGIDLKDALHTTNAELGSIGIAINDR